MKWSLAILALVMLLVAFAMYHEPNVPDMPVWDAKTVEPREVPKKEFVDVPKMPWDQPSRDEPVDTRRYETMPATAVTIDPRWYGISVVSEEGRR